MSIKLLPCPFCGSSAEIINIEGNEDQYGVGAQCVQCLSCGVASGLVYPLMEDVTNLLVERWNKRVNTKDRPMSEGIQRRTR